MTVDELLRRAQDLASAGRRDEALAALIEAWRAHPAVELGALVDAAGAAWRPTESPITRRGGRSAIEAWKAALASAGPTALPWLLEEMAQATSPSLMSSRLTALTERPTDPRVSQALVALVDALPHHGANARGLWISVFREIERIGDPRGLEALLSIRAGVLAYRREPLRHTGRVVVKELEAIAKRIAERPPFPSLSESAQALVAALREQLVQAESGATAAPTAAVSEEELLAAICAAPDDDGARLVYADWLTERGDARGELITLQCARAKSGAEPTRRERALLKDHERAWLGPLAPVVLRGGVRFSRGFLAAFRFKAQLVSDDALIGHPAWATVEEVDTNPHVFVTRAVKWLAHPVASSLRTVYGIADGSLDELRLDGRALPWETIGLRSFRPVDELLPEVARARDAGIFPSLRMLDLSELVRFEARILERVIEHLAGADLASFATRVPFAAVADAVRLVATHPGAPARVLLRSEGWEREPLSGTELVLERAERGSPITVAATFRGSTWSAGVLEPIVAALAPVEPALCARVTLDLAPALRKKPGVDKVLAPLRTRFADTFALI